MSSGGRGLRIGRTLTLIALALAAATGWAAAATGPHCASHSSAAAAHSDSHAPSAWTGPAGHECSHCPPSDCARIAPCTASASAAPSRPAAAVADPNARRVEVSVPHGPHPYPPLQPLTPPPQTVS